jgi:hypothetical protein
MLGNLQVSGDITSNGNINGNNLSISNAATITNLTVTGNVSFPQSGGNSSLQLPSNVVIAPNGVLDLTGGKLITPWIGTSINSPGGGESTPGNIFGTWTLGTNSRLQATYADLAERFASDAHYDAGTVVELGGIKEITAVVKDLSDKVFGVISNCAAYIMNSAAGNDTTHPTVAMTGRVPVKVVGTVAKGDRLVSAGNGRARAAREGEATSFTTIGRSLVDKTTEDQGIVEAIVTIK